MRKSGPPPWRKPLWKVLLPWVLLAGLAILAYWISVSGLLCNTLGSASQTAPATSGGSSPANQSGDINAQNTIVTATVSSVYDGDTFHARLGDQTETVRVTGVDTPELTRPDYVSAFAQQGGIARDFTVALVDGQTVYLEITAGGERDRYGRLLAYVWLSPPSTDPVVRQTAFIQNTLNGRLISAGMAEPITIAPNTEYAPQIAAAAAEAEAAGRGLWPSGCFSTTSGASDDQTMETGLGSIYPPR